MRDTKQRVLDVFEAAFPTDLSIKEAAERSGLGRPTTSTYIKVLVAEGRLEETRTIGNAILFRLRK